MSDHANDNDFYEDDEPIDEVMRAFAEGEKGLTAPPARGITVWVDSAGHATHGPTTHGSQELVSR